MTIVEGIELVLDTSFSSSLFISNFTVLLYRFHSGTKILAQSSSKCISAEVAPTIYLNDCTQMVAALFKFAIPQSFACWYIYSIVLHCKKEQI